MGLQWIVLIKGIMLIAVAFQPMDARVSSKNEPVTEIDEPVRPTNNKATGLVVYQVNTNYELSR